MRQLDQSLQRLQTDHVDVLQIHEADFLRWWVDIPASNRDEGPQDAPLIQDDEHYDFIGAPVISFLENAKKAGKANFVGITTKDARRAARVLQALDIDVVMVAHQLNPIMRNASEFLLPATEEQNIGVLVAAPFMRGLLATPRQIWRTAPPLWMDEKFQHSYFSFIGLSDRVGIPPAELTIRWLLGEARKHSIVFGFRSVEDVHANVEAAERGTLPTSLHAEIDDLGIVHPLIFQGRTKL